MINKVWFWLAIIGFFTAISVDLYEIAFIPKQFSSRLVTDAEESVVKEATASPLVIRTSRKGTITTEALHLNQGDDLYQVSRSVEELAPFLKATVEEFIPPVMVDESYLQGIRNSFLRQYKGDETGNYYLLFRIHPEHLEQYGDVRDIFFQKPVEELGITRRNTVFNAPFTAFGSLQRVVDEIISYSRIAVELALGLVGIMALWLGLMKIAEQSGMITILARMIKPLTRLLFPDIPPEHPAVGAMLMNISANMLGLGNAATPLGLKAMEELQKINPDKETASNAMVMFLVLNTSGLALIPTTVLAIRISAGSVDPFSIIGPVLIATATATIVGVIAAKILQRFYPYSPSEENNIKEKEE